MWKDPAKGHRPGSPDVIAMYAIVDSLAGRTGGTLTATRPAAVPTPPEQPDHRQTPARIPTQRPPSDCEWSLAHRPEAVADARHLTEHALEAWRLADDAVDEVLLVVSELVTNAVEHALAPMVLHLHREHTAGRVWIGVTDGGPAPQDGQWTRTCADDEHGRGLTLIDALCETHGTRTHTSGHTTHWARLNPTP